MGRLHRLDSAQLSPTCKGTDCVREHKPLHMLNREVWADLLAARLDLVCCSLAPTADGDCSRCCQAGVCTLCCQH